MVLTASCFFLDTDAYDVDDLILMLEDENVDIDKELEIPRFQYKNKAVYNTTHNFKTGKFNLWCYVSMYVRS